MQTMPKNFRHQEPKKTVLRVIPGCMQTAQEHVISVQLTTLVMAKRV